ncbi:MAG: ferrous iron transport protein B [Armatimonadota bacterium]
MSEITSEDSVVVALAGNPNAGKTTVFNLLTGARQHVGNYPGVTVERKEGHATYDDQSLHIVDLPGTYSLTPYSLEELVARNFVIDERPDVVVDVVDATNLERNLYLATQFMELNVPVVIALNMIDLADNRGLKIDHNLLSQLLGVPVVPLVGTTGEGKQELLDTILEVSQKHRTPKVTVNFGSELEPHIAQVARKVQELNLDEQIGTSARWIAIKLLEDDAEVMDDIRERLDDPGPFLDSIQEAQRHIERVIGDDPEIAVGDRRYGFIAGACRRAVSREQESGIDVTQLIDDVVTNRVLGIPIFLVMMWLMFELVFRLGDWPMQGIEWSFELIGQLAAAHLPPGQLQSAIVDGIVGGVGGVLAFVPNILLLFMFIAFIEDSGYMARAAFVVDRLMSKIGLHGRSFIPMLIGFGCTVPAVLATRTIDDEKNRLTTMLVAPLMSCSARLPVYLLLAGAFFAPEIAGKVIFSIYIIGVLLAIVVAMVLRSYVLPGETTPFVMELPPYRMPTLRGILVHTWERTWMYIRKAGTVILTASIIMWFLLSYPQPPADWAEQAAGPAHSRAAYTYAGRLGKFIEPAIEPLGFDWKMGTSLVAGFAAKEIVVSTMGTLYSLEQTDEEDRSLRQAVQNDPAFNPLVAYCLMLFVLIYIPCMAVVAVVKQETNGWKWPLFLIVYTTGLAWIVAFCVYQVGSLFI